MLDDPDRDEEECDCKSCRNEKLIDVLSDILSIHFITMGEGDPSEIAEHFKDFGQTLYNKISLHLVGYNGESIN